MKPAPFEYVAPRSLNEALAALADGGPDAKLLAGGQSLIPLLNFPVKGWSDQVWSDFFLRRARDDGLFLECRWCGGL